MVGDEVVGGFDVDKIFAYSDPNIVIRLFLPASVIAVGLFFDEEDLDPPTNLSFKLKVPASVFQQLSVFNVTSMLLL